MLLGISGFMRSGKDTLGDHLVENYGYKKTGFAKTLKDAVQNIFGFTHEQVYGNLKETPDERYRFTGLCTKCGQECSLPPPSIAGIQDRDWFCAPCNLSYPIFVTPRLAMQSMGTEWGRRLCDGIWVMACINEIRQSDCRNWVITDVRFRNEVQAVQDTGGLMIRLRRGELSTTHASEAELAEMEDSEFDLAVDNLGTLEEFYAKIDSFMPHVLSGKYPPR